MSVIERFRGRLVELLSRGLGVGLVLAVAAVAPGQTIYEDVTASHLPSLTGPSMDAGIGDIDGDGHPDVVLAVEFERNLLLLNDGHGRLVDASAQRLPDSQRDSEDVAIVDLDGDGDPDLVFVTEDDLVNELWINDGSGFFTDASHRLPVSGRSNALVVSDLDGDGFPDLIIGNYGLNEVLINDGTGSFTAEPERLPPNLFAVTQDLELGDVDGDGDLDLFEANQGPNRLYLNDGHGYFSEAVEHLPGHRDETREADFGDIDGDGDLDVFVANVELFLFGVDRQNRILINDGLGVFSDETFSRLPEDPESTFDGDFVDVDGDGHLDIVTANALLEPGTARLLAPRPFRVFVNDGFGVFAEDTGAAFPDGVSGYGFDIEAADLDGDRVEDLYLVSRFREDRLLLSTRAPTCIEPWCENPGPRRPGGRLGG